MHNTTPKTIGYARALRKRMTDAEVILWSRLRRHEAGGFHFRKQHPVGHYIADFACPKARLVVEVDGDTHSTDEQIAHDCRREQYLREHGWRILRVRNEEVYRDLDVVMDAIARELPSG